MADEALTNQQAFDNLCRTLLLLCMPVTIPTSSCCTLSHMLLPSFYKIALQSISGAFDSDQSCTEESMADEALSLPRCFEQPLLRARKLPYSVVL
jgi:hypothetical protein